MSRRYDVARVSTLNPIVPPWSTLMSVAKPWMAELPDPVMPHWLSGVPGLVFSQATGLWIGASHGAASAGGADGTTMVRVAATSTAATYPGQLRRLRDRAW